MAPLQPKIILWTGPVHSGKTTTAAELVERARAEGFRVAGILSLSIYCDGTLRDGALAGFDVTDVQTGARAPLARRDRGAAEGLASFTFSPEGLELGNTALGSAAARSAALVVVDEFGPLELRGQGWRPAVDALLSSARGVVLLVVRERLAHRAARLYASHRPQVLPAGSADQVLAVLREQAGATD